MKTRVIIKGLTFNGALKKIKIQDSCGYEKDRIRIIDEREVEEEHNRVENEYRRKITKININDSIKHMTNTHTLTSFGFSPFPKILLKTM